MGEALAGHGEAFAWLVRRYQDRAYGVAIGMLADFELARDVVQEAFLCAFRDLGKLKEPARFPGWLHGIVRHTAHRALRELERVRSLAGELSRRADAACPAPPPDRSAEEAEQRQLVRHALGRLSEKSREAVSLFYVDGLSYADIAGFLGVTETAVRGRLHRGRAALRKELNVVARSFKDEQLPEDFSAAVQRLLDELAGGGKQGEQTVALLAEIGVRAVDPLCEALGDPRDVVREAAARALCRIGDPRAVRPVLRVLYAGDWRTRKAILRTGKILRISGVRDELLGIVREGEPERQYWAIQALAHAEGDDEVYGCLARVFRTPGSGFRHQALAALCKLRPDHAPDLVAEALGDADLRRCSGWAWWIAVRDGLVLPIEVCMGGFGRDVPANSRRMAGHVVLRHGAAGRKALEDLMGTGSPDQRATAALALAHEKHPGAFKVLLDELLNGYRERKWSRMVSRALVRECPRQLAEWARQARPDVTGRPAVAWALGQVRIAAGEASADDALRFGPPSVRAAAVRQLARSRGAGFLPELRQCLREGRPRKVAQEAFWQMFRLGEAALPTAEEMLVSEHWTERKAAVCLLRWWGRLTPAQKARAERDAHIAVRHAAVRRRE